MSLDAFSAPVRTWFETTFGSPTPPQAQGWPAIAAGRHALILAPTGSGKTLASFLWGIDRLMTEPVPEERTKRTRLLYISPLRALAVDIEKNLRAPLKGIRLAAERLGVEVHEPTVAIRTGDTPPEERRRLQRHPPDLLITTPESLYLLLTSQARETLQSVQAVIVDEIHALAATKRGAHLSLSLERLEHLVTGAGNPPPQRIGLSATQRPLEEIARYLGGFEVDPGQGTRRQREVTIVDAGVRKALEVEVVVPVEDMGQLGETIAPVDPDAPVTELDPTPTRRSIWPAMHPRLLELIESHRSTLVFVNARRLAERLATRLNELAIEGETHGNDGVGARGTGFVDPGLGGPGAAGGAGAESTAVELVKAHHGSLSRERRLQIEDELKSGRLRGLVCTSSLELGIDMGAVDLVVQVESPRSVAAGLQRIGRAGHQVGAPSKGKLFPKHRADLVEAAVVVDRMQQGLVERTRYPRNPLDVLAQQIVAMVALDEWNVDELAAVVRGSANFADLTDDVFHATLDLLAGRYPSEEFGELRPRIVWDRVSGTVRARKGAQRLAVTNPGTIPDRGLFGVFLPDGTRVGELDEEMVYESRVGETFLLGASTWRIEDITYDRVVVVPAPGQPGKMPFWHGDGPGRPLELGRAVGQFVRELRGMPADAALERLSTRHGLDELAARNLLQYLEEQAEATGTVPDDRTIVVERFRDEIGDWRVCVLSPFGAQVHAPWAMALRARLSERWGLDVELIWSDDGIVLRLPEAVDELPLEDLAISPEDIDELVVSALPDTSMFASRFREAAARALLLPKQRPDRRTPLWQQRQRAADLLQVASKYPQFPILLEATRECINDVFDLPALREVLSDIRSRKVRLVPVDTQRASPMAQSLLFSWIAVYMYEGDAPLAERRAAALALDRDLLRDLLGAEELRELLDPGVLADVELELQHLAPGRRARDADEVHDLLRRLGPLSLTDLDARSEPTLDVAAAAARLVEERRAIRAVIAGEERLAAAEDAARLRDALGVALPVGLPTAFTDPVDAPLDDLVARFARTHGPFTTDQVAAWLGLDHDDIRPVLERLAGSGRVVLGEFRPEGSSREWCDDDVLRQLRRRSLAVLRKEVEPVEQDALARFLPAWQSVGSRRRGIDGLAEVLAQLQGAALPASALEADILPARLGEYRPADLDALCTAGQVVWVGAGSLGSSDGRVRLAFRDQAALLIPPPDPFDAQPLHQALLDHLAARGASFWPDLTRAVAAAGIRATDAEVLAALWDLVWAGLVTNDGMAPLRALSSSGRGSRSAGAAARPRAPRVGLRRAAVLGPPAGAGRWSLVAPLLEPAPSPTEQAHARAAQLLERYGVLTREATLAEGVEGGFAGLYPVLKALEERGRVRRGYFVAGLGAAQFALPGAVDRLRSFRSAGGDRGDRGFDEIGGGFDGVDDGLGGTGDDGEGPVIALSAVDPAQPYGAALRWPESPGRPSRSAGAHVLLAAGRPVAFLERGGHGLTLFPAAADRPDWPTGLLSLLERRRYRSIEIRTVDGQPVREHPEAVAALHAHGWQDTYKGLTRRLDR